MAQGFSVGGEYTGASIFVAEYSPDRKRGFMGSWLDFGSIAGFVLGAGVVVLISTIVGEANFLDWGWRIPFFIALPLGIIGLYPVSYTHLVFVDDQHAPVTWRSIRRDCLGEDLTVGAIHRFHRRQVAVPGDIHFIEAHPLDNARVVRGKEGVDLYAQLLLHIL